MELSKDESLVEELKERVKHMEENAWTQSIDAVVWAQKFMEYKKRMRWTHSDIDESLMTTWFANAIMAGYDEATRRSMNDRHKVGE
jgi:hypothetical protein